MNDNTKVDNYTMDQLLSMVQEKAALQDYKRVTSAETIFSVLHEYTLKEKEYFLTITLDNNSMIIQKRVIHIGTLNSSLVHPREVFKPAILDNAAGLIIAHNHPSGVLDPSYADIKITKRLKKVSEIVGVDLLDHVILSKHGYFSFKDNGIIL